MQQETPVPLRRVKRRARQRQSDEEKRSRQRHGTCRRPEARPVGVRPDEEEQRQGSGVHRPDAQRPEEDVEGSHEDPQLKQRRSVVEQGPRTEDGMRRGKPHDVQWAVPPPRGQTLQVLAERQFGSPGHMPPVVGVEATAQRVRPIEQRRQYEESGEREDELPGMHLSRGRQTHRRFARGSPVWPRPVGRLRPGSDHLATAARDICAADFSDATGQLTMTSTEPSSGPSLRVQPLVRRKTVKLVSLSK